MAPRVVTTGWLDQTERYIRRIENERDELKRQLDAAGRENTELQSKLWDAERPVPTSLSDVTARLKAAVPSIVQAPAFSILTKATDAASFANGLYLLLLHAQLVARKERNL